MKQILQKLQRVRLLMLQELQKIRRQQFGQLSGCIQRTPRALHHLAPHSWLNQIESSQQLCKESARLQRLRRQERKVPSLNRFLCQRLLDMEFPVFHFPILIMSSCLQVAHKYMKWQELLVRHIARQLVCQRIRKCPVSSQLKRPQ